MLFKDKLEATVGNHRRNRPLDKVLNFLLLLAFDHF